MRLGLAVGRVFALALVLLTAITGYNAKTCFPVFQDMMMTMSWKNIQWPTSEDERQALSSCYNITNMIPTRMQMWRSGAYLTFPRLKPGIPFSLGYVSLTSETKCDTELYAYPSWWEHSQISCINIVNAVDIYLDRSETLWVLDTGQINTLQKPQVIRLPRVFAIDVKKRKVVKVIDLSQFVCAKSRLQFVVADVTDDNTTNIYVSDAATRSIIVYNRAGSGHSQGFRVMLPPPICSPKDCTRDVLYLMLLFNTCTQKSQLFFSYLGGKYVFSAVAQDMSKGKTFASIAQVGKKPGKLVFLGTDLGPNLFFRQEDDNVIYSWNVTTSFSQKNFIEKDKPATCRQATSVTKGYRNVIWALESNICDYLSGNFSSMGPSARMRPLAVSCSA